jgi:hypothetical protein
MKTIELTRDGFKTVWRNSKTRGMIDVDVFVEGETVPCLEWSYGKVVGNSILGNASFWLDQVILEARHQN